MYCPHVLRISGIYTYTYIIELKYTSRLGRTLADQRNIWAKLPMNKTNFKYIVMTFVQNIKQ